MMIDDCTLRGKKRHQYQRGVGLKKYCMWCSHVNPKWIKIHRKKRDGVKK
jgi:hypothetical protein